MQYSNKAYLLIGGNVGDRIAYLNKARALLQLHAGTETASSPVYETAAWGITDQAAFLNQALIIETPLGAEELLDNLLKAELEIGRERGQKFGPRIIDIDILLFNEEVYDLTHLAIPHPQLPNRRFALQPLCDIAPDLIHPVSNKTIRQLLTNCSDPLQVTLYKA